MKQLMTEVNGAIEAELSRAQVNFGRTYHSPHEGYGVLAEELWEAEEEHDHVDYIRRLILRALQLEDNDIMLQHMQGIAERATLAACEYIQVAAVAKKMILTLKEADPNG